MKTRLPHLCVALLLATCSSSSEDQPVDISPADYDQTCDLDEDCMLIFAGDPCSCSCDYAAINVADKDEYFDDLPDGDCDIQCGACEGVEAFCDAGQCGVREN